MLRDADLHYINEAFDAAQVSPGQMELLLANGWRHFGAHFFRYNFGFHKFDIRRVIPLRIRLADFSFSKSQRRVLRKNSDLDALVQPVKIDEDAEELFDRHKQRFEYGVPDSIYDFLSDDPACSPCEAKEIRVLNGEKTLAVSYFDICESSTSGIYAMFEPDAVKRSLGIFTMLKEIEFSIDSEKEFYYQGYCYEGESFYDYKKRFRGTEAFDWKGRWDTFTAETQSREDQ
ncbi:MAG: arginine-tRNA-protein transferase [Blastocatellia bacterium]